MRKIALLSVFQKEGIVEYALDLVDLGWEIISSGGTARTIAEAGIPVTEVSGLTGYPAMLGHRVVTLHPAVHGGILARRIPEDEADLKKFDIPRISHVCVDLSPVGKFTHDPHRTILEILDMVDIGGPTLIRGAAKNNPHGMIVVCDPHDRSLVLDELKHYDWVREPIRAKLAAKVFAVMAEYDSSIARRLYQEWRLPYVGVVGFNGQSLRYGTNPHQGQANVFHEDSSYHVLFEGKPLSYTNWLEITFVVELMGKLPAEQNVCSIFKHLSPCGVAKGETLVKAFEAAWKVDSLSAFGSTIAVNGVVDLGLAKMMSQNFFETLVCQGINKEALKHLKNKRKNLRVVQTDRVMMPFDDELEVIRRQGIILTQEPDSYIPKIEDFTQVSQKAATPKQLEDLVFTALCCQIIYSNSTVIGRRGKMIAWGRNGASRVDVCDDAVVFAEMKGRGLNQSVAVTDGFFPFPDGLEVLAKAGIKVIACPNVPTAGIKAKEVIRKADELGVAFYHIDHRLFRH